jgi:hypothetical protein
MPSPFSMYVPLLEALATELNCKVKQLQEYMDNPLYASKADLFIRRNRGLRTAYEGKNGRRHIVLYSILTTKSAHDLPAYEGYLGISVRQHFYSRHKLKLVYPYLRCVTEECPNTHLKFYPLELLEVFVDPLFCSRVQLSRQQRHTDVPIKKQVTSLLNDTSLPFCCAYRF